MENIIEQFKVVFGLDNSQFNDGIKETETTFKKFATNIVSIAGTYFSAQIFAGLLTQYAEFNNQLANSIKMLDISAEEASALGGVLKRYGGDVNSATSSLQSLSRALQEAKFGGGALIEVAKKYGIAFQNSDGSLMNSSQLLRSLGSQVTRFDKQTQLAIGSALGLDESLIRALSDGTANFNKLLARQKEFGVVTKEDLKLSSQFEMAMLDLKDSFGGVTRMLARLFMPIVTKMVNAFVDFIEYLKKHKALLLAFFSALLVALTPILATFIQMAIASATAFAPFYGIVAVITTIALICEDIYGYFMGWDTITGDLVKKFPALGVALEAIRPIVMGIKNVFVSIIDWLKDPTWEKFVNIFKTAGQVIKDLLMKPIRAVLDMINSAIDTLTGWLTDNPVIKWIMGDDAPKAPPPPPAPPAQVQSSNTTNNVNVTQNIQSPTPKQLADQTNNLLQGINSQREKIKGQR